MRFSSVSGLTTGAILVGFVAGHGTAGAAGVTLQPHRAVYDLELDRTSAGGSIAGVKGRLVYELMGNACEGYAQNMRFVTETMNTEGQSEVSDLRTSSWEDAPAHRMRFNSSTYGNDQLVEQTQGVATKVPGKDTHVAIDLAKPARKTAKISEPVLFPIEHSLAVIGHASAGRRFFAANLYDGSEGGQKYYYTASAIGAPTGPGQNSRLAHLANGEKLAAVPSWPVSISYFKPDTKHVDSLPLYEMSFRFHANGIASEIRIDQGDYKLKGELKELVLLEANPCTKPGN